MSRNRPYTTITSRYLWQSHWYNVRQDQLQDDAGHQITYTVIDKPDAVWIVPVTSGGDLVLIDQYRYAIDAWCLEIPSGNVEAAVEPADMAARELREEIGGVATRLDLIADFYTMNGIGTERALIFLALGVELGEPQREITEHITLKPTPVIEALDMARTGQIKDGPSALAILLCEPALRAYVAELES
ncbi:MAG: NUDIX hydrolase [Anaerolineae bacterium]|nr:NUDIX hydrolase [Anaerolineae bacterium]